jgi:hypothetical protein
MNHVIREYLKSTRITSVWDVFAGIGTDAIAFSTISNASVVATEVNPMTYSHLVKNIIEFKATGSVVAINVDACEIMDVMKPGLIYFDPPWGETFRSGREFLFDEVSLPNGMPILTLLTKFKDTGLPMIIKSPLLCNSFEQVFPSDRISRILTFTQQRLKFIFITGN